MARLRQRTLWAAVVWTSAALWVMPPRVAWAQLPTVPSEVSPGVLQDQLRRSVPVPPMAVQVPSVPPEQALVRPPGADSIRLVVRDVVVDGSRVIGAADMAPLWQDMLGRDVTLSAVYDLADRLTALYRNKGYVLSAVTVPQQTIQGGVVRLTAIEGYVGSVDFDAGVQPTARMRAEAAALAAERPLTARTLERQMLLLNELAGITAQAYFEPGSQTGEAKLTIKAVRRAVSGSVGVQNRVSRLLGDVAIEARVTVNNVLGWDESHSLLLQTTNRARLRSVGYAYNQPLGSDGLAMNLFLGHVESRIDSSGTPLRSASDIVTLGLTYPLIRSRAETLRLRARLNVYNGTQDFREFQFVQEDRARALRVGASWDRTDAAGVSFADVELSKGISGLGATRPAVDTAQRTNADYGFTKFTYFLGRLQHLGGDFSLQASVQGQWTRDPLPPSERAALGGELILRAFTAGELIGDRAQAAKLELRYEPSLIPGGRVSFYGFVEAGRTRTLETLVADTVQKGVSTGLGVRGSLAGGLNFYLEAAQQHRRSNVVSTSHRRSRVFAGLSYEF